MRGRIAAACAAVLVGLAPAGLVACAPWLPAGAWSCSAAAPSRDTRRLISNAPLLPLAAARATPGFAAVRGEAAQSPPEEAPAIWRSPSGPAPSQAPPAA